MKINAAKLKEKREGKGLRLADLAVAADLSERRIMQLEQKGGNVNLNVGKAIAKALGMKDSKELSPV